MIEHTASPGYREYLLQKRNAPPRVRIGVDSSDGSFSYNASAKDMEPPMSISAKFSDPIPHDGTCCPCRVGEQVRHWHRDGLICTDVIEEGEHIPRSIICGFFGGISMRYSAWCWAINERPEAFSPHDIVQYQILGIAEGEHYTQRVSEDA